MKEIRLLKLLCYELKSMDSSSVSLNEVNEEDIFSSIDTYIGAISDPCCISAPTVNQNEFVSVN